MIITIYHHHSKSEKVISACCTSPGAQPLPEQKCVLLPAFVLQCCVKVPLRADVQCSQGERFRESEIPGWKGMSGIIWFNLSWLNKVTQHPLQLGLKSIQCWESITSPGKLFQQLIVLVVKNVPFMSVVISSVTCTHYPHCFDKKQSRNAPLCPSKCNPPFAATGRQVLVVGSNCMLQRVILSCFLAFRWVSSDPGNF